MDEIQRIILQVENEAKLRALNDALATEQKLMASIIEQQQKGAITAAQYSAQMEKSAKAVADLQRQAGGIGGGGRGNPQDRLALTYMLDDFLNTAGGVERKLASLSNNIPQFLAMFGANAPWVGGLALAGTAIVGLLTHSEQLMQLWSGEKPKAMDQALKRIQGAARAAAGEFDRMMSGQDPEARARIDAFQGAVQGRGPQFEEQLTQAMLPAGAADQLGRAIAERDKTIQGAMGVGRDGNPLFDPGQQQGIIARANAEFARKKATITKGFGGQAEFLTRQVLGGDAGAFEKMQGIISGKPGIFGEDFVTRFMTGAPGARKAKQQFEEFAADRAEAEADAKRKEEFIQREKDAEFADDAAKRKAQKDDINRVLREGAAAIRQGDQAIKQAQRAAESPEAMQAALMAAQQENAILEASAAADQVLGVNSEALQRFNRNGVLIQQLSAKLQAVMMRAAVDGASQSHMGNYSPMSMMPPPPG